MQHSHPEGLGVMQNSHLAGVDAGTAKCCTPDQQLPGVGDPVVVLPAVTHCRVNQVDHQ